MVLDINGYLEKAMGYIENEIQETWPNKLFVSFNELFTLKSVRMLYTYGVACGIKIHSDVEEIFNGKTLYFTVPETTVVKYNNKDDEIDFKGVEAAKLVKSTILQIIKNFCIRRFTYSKKSDFVDSITSELSFKWKSEGDVTQESYSKYMIVIGKIKSGQIDDELENLKDNEIHEMVEVINQMNDDQINDAKKMMQQISMLRTYGCEFESFNDIQKLATLRNMNSEFEFVISVPEFSTFKNPNGDGSYSGKILFDDAVNTLKMVGFHLLRNIKYKMNIRTGEKWTSDNYSSVKKIEDIKDLSLDSLIKGARILNDD